MQYKEYKDGIKLSRLGMGNMRLPVKNGDDAQIDYDKAKILVDQCMKDGINYYDTAYIYHGGESERFVGKALADFPRGSFYIADKYNLQANPDYRVQFAEQLERLQMDYIDFYLLHGIQDGFMADILDNGCIEYFDKQKKQGNIKFMGFSYHGSPANLYKILEVYQWDFVQIQLNYYDWYTGDAKELYEILKEAQIPVMVMEPVHGGLLANMTKDAEELFKGAEPDKSVASWAMRWVMELDNVQVVLSGMSDSEQLADNVHTFEDEQSLSEEDQKLIEHAAHIQYAEVAVACTACRYCCPECPVGLDIPFLIKEYNDAKVGGAWRLSSLMTLSKEKLPAACIGCGSCTKHCPQMFDIPLYMNEMNEMMMQ